MKERPAIGLFKGVKEMPVLAAVAVPHPPLIIPEVGKGEEKRIQHTINAYQQAMRFLARFKPDTVVLTTPHTVMYADYFHISPGKSACGDLSRFNAPQAKVEIPYDEDFVHQLESYCQEHHIHAGTLGELDPSLDHATVVPLLFLEDYLNDFELVRVGLSGLSIADHYRLGEAISAVADKTGKRVVMIASGDLSHKLTAEGPYGFSSEGPKFDKELMECFEDADFLRMMTIKPEVCESAAECGHRSFVIMAGAFDRRKVDAHVLSYEGPFGVGYGVATFEGEDPDPDRDFLDKLEAIEDKEYHERLDKEDPYVKLARLSVETFVKTGQYAPLPNNLPADMMDKRAGVFVSLHEHGRLRGCIGTTEPTQANIALEIIANGVSACSRDPRFPPVQPEELKYLVYKVDVLEPAEKISSEDELDPKVYGVIVEKGSRRGLLLPDLEGVDSVAQQVSIAKQKAGIAENESVQLYRFKVVRHS